ncbi:MAG TPA: nuclear transport factor 2 family protein [Candidatus Dormibacteraeota bacterium]
MSEHTASAPDTFLSALTSRDFERFATSLAPAAQARFFLPRGPEIRTGREEIARRFEGWFAPASSFEVLDTSCEPVGARHRLTWRFGVMRDGQSRELIEQLAFVDVTEEGIAGIDMLCSGFIPAGEPAPNIFNAESMGCAEGLAQEFRNRLTDLEVGESLTVIVGDPAAKEDLPALARMMGQSITACELQPADRLAITVEKRK